VSEKIVHRKVYPGGWIYEEYEGDTFDFFHIDPVTGQRTLYSFKPAERRHPDLPEFQPLIHEVARADGTIGIVRPLVAKYKGNWYVAVQRNQRHAGPRVEVARKSWDNPNDLPALPEGAKVEVIPLDRGDSNTARVVGGDGIVDEIAVIRGAESLPKLAGKPFWMKFKTYAKTRDKMGQSVLFKARELKILD
jgi:hypothetical protein